MEAGCGTYDNAGAIVAELAKWIRAVVSGLPEGYQPAVRVFDDFVLVDVLGLKIAVETCVDARAAVERCRARLGEWPIDMCLATRRGAGAEQYVIVHHGGEVDLGAVALAELSEALRKRDVYRTVVKRDYVGEVAAMLKAALDSAASAPPHVLAAQRIRDVAKVHGGGAVGWEEEEGEEE